MKKVLPRNTVARLSQYRRLLEKYRYLHEPFIFSHDLARMLDLKPVNVRHDLMLLGVSGDRRRGYSVSALLEKIGENIDCLGQGVVLIGMGRLGMSLIDYINNSNTTMTIVAAFDIDPEKVGKEFDGVPCLGIDKMTEFIQKRKLYTAILTVPNDSTTDILPFLRDAGIRGVLNYTSSHLVLPDKVIVKNVDATSYLEEIAYFIK